MVAILASVITACSSGNTEATSNDIDGTTTTDSSTEVATAYIEDEYEGPNIPKETVFSDYKKATLMIYMVGSNLETEGAMATLDIEEIIASGYDESKLDVYICTGGAKEWHTEAISSTTTQVYRMLDGKLELICELGDAAMSNSSTLTSFIDVCYEVTDGDTFELILWNHGAGANIGFGADEKNGYTSMSIEQLGQGLANTKLIMAGRRFEVIGFDACLMGMIEVANTLSYYSHYMLASEELMPTNGWDYSVLSTITEECAFRGEAFGTIIIDGFAEYYKNQYQYRTEYSLACYDLSYSKDVLDLFEDMIIEDLNGIEYGEYATIARGRNHTKGFGRVDGQDYYDIIDLYDFALNMEGYTPTYSDNLETAIDNMVIYYRSNILHSHGVAVYFPYNNQNNMNSWLDNYDSLQFSYVYEEFLNVYVASLIDETKAIWDNVDVSVVYSDEDFDYDCYVEMNDEQSATFASAMCSRWIRYEDSSDTYGCYMIQGGVKVSGNCLDSAQYTDKIFVFSNKAGDGISFSMKEIDRCEEYVLYEGRIRVQKLDSTSWDNVDIVVKVDDEHPNGEIIIARYVQNITDTKMFPSVMDYTFEIGDTIEGEIKVGSIAMNSDGSLLAEEKWKNSTSVFSDGLTFDGELNSELRDYSEDMGMSFMLFYIRDTHGYTHTAGRFPDANPKLDGAYLMNGTTTSLTVGKSYDPTSYEAAIFDTYNQPVHVFTFSDLYEISGSTTSKKIDVKVLDGVMKKEISHMYISNDLEDDYADYIEYGIKPDLSQNPFFTCNVDKESIDGMDVYILTYNINKTTELLGKKVLIPYIDCYGEQRYLQIECEMFDDDDNDEILEWIESIL